MTYRHTRIAAHLGMATQAVAINLPALLFVVFHDEFGASTAALGTLVAATFGVQMAVDALGARFVDRIGYRAAAPGAARAAASLFGGGAALPLGLKAALLAALLFPLAMLLLVRRAASRAG